MARGHIPADIMFIGEAPGDSEDSIGVPFVGPAGKDRYFGLNRIIQVSVPRKYRYCITNVLGCIPKGSDGKKTTDWKSPKVKGPIITCRPRLLSLLAITKPRLVVCVGSVSRQYIPENYLENRGIPFVEIIHPAAILRLDVSQKTLAVKRAIITVADAVEEFLEPEKPPF